MIIFEVSAYCLEPLPWEAPAPMAVSVEELRQLVDTALAAGAAVEDDPEAASRAIAALGQLAQQQVHLFRHFARKCVQSACRKTY